MSVVIAEENIGGPVAADVVVRVGGPSQDSLIPDIIPNGECIPDNPSFLPKEEKINLFLLLSLFFKLKVRLEKRGNYYSQRLKESYFKKLNSLPKMTKNSIIKIAFFSAVIITAVFLVSDFALAYCPSDTVASGTQATLVGEITQSGSGDPNFTVWFQYGRNNVNENTTSHFSKYGSGLFCTDIYNLQPCSTYYYRAVASNSGTTSYGETRNFTTTCTSISVDLRANGSNGPIYIPYESLATLSWNSENADYCYASNAWSGSKGTSGSESTGTLTSSRTYTLTCSGPGGSASDSVTINIESQPVYVDFSMNKTVRNITTNTSYSDLIYANPGNALTFGIVIRAENKNLYNVIVKDVLPSGLIYRGDLRVDDVLTSGDIFSGLNIGTIPAGQKKTITYRADVAGAESFSFGQTQLTNSVDVSSSTTSRYDTAKVVVSRVAVAGVATAVSTGLTNNILFDSFLLPLLATLLIIWLFKSRIVRFEEWLEARKKEYQTFKSEKMLRLKIAKIKAKEFFRLKA